MLCVRQIYKQPNHKRLLISNSSQSNDQTQNSNITVIPTQKNTPFDYTNYYPAGIADYVKDPGEYLDWGTEILTGQIDDFLAAGDRGVSHNYIELTDDSVNAAVPPDKMMIEIDSDTAYKAIVYSVKKGSLVDVWGIGSPSQQFETTSSSGSSSSYEPVLTLQRIDECRGSSCANGSTVNVYLQTQ